jgi:Mg-chelatase subunit ChlD
MAFRSAWVFAGILACGAMGPVCTQARAEAPLQLAAPAKPAPKPRLEVVFVLDTTGSMSGLIEGAKRKIWSIADELASAEPTPELRVGLIAYRDRGDAYVTRRFELTNDLDAVYEKLQSLAADGGGDGPESVNQALYEAVEQTQWTMQPSVYRAVFLVGDAPPHMDYEGDVPYTRTAAIAAKRGIVVNTVQCGAMQETAAIWSRIAKRTQGTYAAIEQNGGMLAIAAPMDDEIAKLNAELADSVVAYGDAAQVRSVHDKAARAKSASVEAGAARHSYLKKNGGGLVTGRGDLVDDVRNGRVALGSLAPSALPAELRDKSTAEQTSELSRRAEQREQIKAKLDLLVEERSRYVKAAPRAAAAHLPPHISNFAEGIIRQLVRRC